MGTSAFPSKPEALLAQWNALSNPEERAVFIDTAIHRSRYDVLTVAATQPHPVATICANKKYAEKLSAFIASKDRVDLLDAVDVLSVDLGSRLRQLNTPKARRDLAARAVAAHSPLLLTRLLSEGLDPRENDKNYHTTLCHMMVSHGWIDGLAIVRQKYPDVLSLSDERGRSLLHTAARYGQTGCVRALLEAGCDVHARNLEGRTVLFACLLEHVENQSVGLSGNWQEVAYELLGAGAKLDEHSGKTERSGTLRERISSLAPHLLDQVERLDRVIVQPKQLHQDTPQASGPSLNRRF